MRLFLFCFSLLFFVEIIFCQRKTESNKIRVGNSFFRSNFIHNIPEHQKNPIFQLQEEYEKDTDKNKVNLGIGSYKDESGKEYVFESVRKVEKKLLDKEFAEHYYQEQHKEEDMPSDGLFDKMYLPKIGFEPLTEVMEEIIFKNENGVLVNNMVSFHTASSSVSLEIIFEFMCKFTNISTIAVSIPTFSEYESIIKAKCPGIEISNYRYVQDRKLRVDLMIEDIKKLPENSMVVLQSSCHNPTGLDPSEDEWEKISKLFQTGSLFPFVDAAYLGFVTGDIHKDSEVVRLFSNLGIDSAVAISFSKNIGLYGERVGTGHIILSKPDLKHNVTTQVQSLNEIPPLQGARDAYFTLKYYYDELSSELTNAVKRVKNMRKSFVDELKKLGSKIDIDHILLENGLFTVLDLTKEQIVKLKEKYHIYIVENGRINIAGLNENNLEYVTKSIYEIVG